MSTLQRRIIGVGIAPVAVMALVPPWRWTGQHRIGPGAGAVVSGAEPMGYSFTFSPHWLATQTDVARIAVQLVALVTIVGGLVAIACGRGKDVGA